MWSTRAGRQGGVQTGGFPIWTCPSFLSFLGLSRFFRDFPDFFRDVPDWSFSSFLVKSTYEEQSRKGPRHNPDLSRKVYIRALQNPGHWKGGICIKMSKINRQNFENFANPLCDAQNAIPAILLCATLVQFAAIVRSAPLANAPFLKFLIKDSETPTGVLKPHCFSEGLWKKMCISTGELDCRKGEPNKWEL